MNRIIYYIKSLTKAGQSVHCLIWRTRVQKAQGGLHWVYKHISQNRYIRHPTLFTNILYFKVHSEYTESAINSCHSEEYTCDPHVHCHKPNSLSKSASFLQYLLYVSNMVEFVIFNSVLLLNILHHFSK